MGGQGLCHEAKRQTQDRNPKPLHLSTSLSLLILVGGRKTGLCNLGKGPGGREQTTQPGYLWSSARQSLGGGEEARAQQAGLTSATHAPATQVGPGAVCTCHPGALRSGQWPSLPTSPFSQGESLRGDKKVD